jgi:hypothetical protein
VTISVGRWVYGGQHAPGNYPWAQCRFCGRAQDGDCPPATCQLCGSVLCHGAGADCRVCHYGFIPGWSRGCAQRVCGRKHCAAEAVAKAPRVGRVCAEHAKLTKLRLVGGRTLTITEYVAERIAHRDAGKGWECWRWAQ